MSAHRILGLEPVPRVWLFAIFLRAIARSPANLQVVFETIVTNGALCEAEFSAVARFEDAAAPGGAR